jgi:hypothetical protein
MKIKLPVTWEVFGIIEVEANSIEDAIKNFDPDLHHLPKDYVDSSFQLSDTDPANVSLYQGSEQ